MNHRAALVAYEQSHRRYTVHRSSAIGRDLQVATRIDAETPYGGDSNGTESRFVEVDPIETGLTLQQVIDRLDFSRFGAVIVVSESFDVTPYRALWFGFSEVCESVYGSDAFGNGALASVGVIGGERPEDEAFCARYRATKRTLGRSIDEGVLSVSEARQRLRRRVAEYEAEDRDVRFATNQKPEMEESTLRELARTGRRLFGQR